VESKDLTAKSLQNIRLQNLWGSWGRAGRRDFPGNPGEFVTAALESQVARRDGILSGVTAEVFLWISTQDKNQKAVFKSAEQGSCIESERRVKIKGI